MNDRMFSDMMLSVRAELLIARRVGGEHRDAFLEHAAHDGSG